MSGLPISTLDVLELAHVIDLTVLDDMRLVIEPQQIARDAEHNSATFRIAGQPAALDQYVCRAEVQNAQGTTYRLVENGEFSLTSDIAVYGTGYLQLVYSDGDAVILKTYPTPFHVSQSINAIDPSDPEYENGLAQLQTAAFAAVQGSDTAATFYNISGQPVAALIYPPGQGGGIDEATADLLYLRLNGANPMQGSVNISGPNRGLVWGDSGIQGALYSDGNQLIFRRAINDTDVVIENNSGAAVTRSPIVTQASGDLRYARPFQLEEYLLKAGGQMTGPLITASGSSVTNPGIGIGDNSTGFYRGGTFLICSVGGNLAWQISTAEFMSALRINMANNQITNVAAPTAAADAANRGYVDAAVAAAPRPNNRIYIPNEITLGNTATTFFDQPFTLSRSGPATLMVIAYLDFDGGTPGAFYDLAYTCSIAGGVEEHISVYLAGGAGSLSYLKAPVVFAQTIPSPGASVQITLTARAAPGPTGALVQIGQRTAQRSYVTVQEMVT